MYDFFHEVQMAMSNNIIKHLEICRLGIVMYHRVKKAYKTQTILSNIDP